MSSKHLGKGSVEPPKNEAVLRLYSMQLCPYSHRARLVLKAKGIPHDIVNINLNDKPEWYLNILPEGKVPALLDGDKLIVESISICDYLDEKFPQNSLYSAEPAVKEKEKDIIKKIIPVTNVFHRCIAGNEEKTPKEWVNEFLAPLQSLEDELLARGTQFFGGEKPNMVDYMLWPFAERAGAVALKLGAKLPIEDNEIAQLRKWSKVMRKDPVASELYYGPEIFWKMAKLKLQNNELDYDALLA